MSKLFGSKLPRRPHLVRGGGLNGEIADVRSDVNEAFEALESGGGFLRTDEFIDPAAADVDAFVTSFATAAAIQVLEGADLDGVVGDDTLTHARNVTITSSTHADVTAVDVVFEGFVIKDGREVPVSVEVTVTAGGNATDASVACMHRITRITVPAMGGAGGSLQIGFGARLGLSDRIRAVAGRTGPVQEVFNASLVVNGAFANPTDHPIASYTPNTAPNAAHDYGVLFVAEG